MNEDTGQPAQTLAGRLAALPLTIRGEGSDQIPTFFRTAAFCSFIFPDQPVK
ncbi:hypothetical protein HBDW_38540 [Herbaspirillum sp. DW155]|uniref:hypothetical protein n=1 Tax=Herbaspirillum sp. DW155 TaxID=3095609 RepID=UPI00308921CF|nr:hypothetical protein HBDW_38540 [Herbaspirillum sp. DW155]